MLEIRFQNDSSITMGNIDKILQVVTVTSEQDRTPPLISPNYATEQQLDSSKVE